MLLCDGCDLGFHMRCLDPPLSAVLAGTWHCANCVGNNGKDGALLHGMIGARDCLCSCTRV